MNLVFQNIAKKFLSSFLKGLIGALIVCLTAFTQAQLPAGLDHATAYTIALLMAGVNALISALKRWATFDLSKLPVVK